MDVYVAIHSLFFIFVSCSVLRLIAGAGEVQTSPLVAVTVGQTATLPCRFNATNLVSLEWIRGADTENAESLLRIFRSNIFPGNDPRFNMTSDFSLVLRESQQSDTNVYWCRVTLQGFFQSSTNLTVSPDNKIPQLSSMLPLPERTRHITTVKPTLGVTTSGKTVGPTKPAPEKLISSQTTIYIIVGCVGFLIILAIAVLVIYCCCCKRKTPEGYEKPKPV